jgi:hypothetical protein
VITDAAWSADEQLRSRRRRYTILMVVHIVGLAVGGSLYERAWGLGLAIIVITGPLQWVAVIIANGAPRRPGPGPISGPRADAPASGSPSDRRPGPADRSGPPGRDDDDPSI